MRGFELLAGSRPLDFVNTVSWGDGGDERLRSASDLVAWCRAAGLRAGGRPDRRVWRRALEMRAALHGTFLAVAEGRRHHPGLDAFLAPALRRLVVRRGRWTLRDPDHAEAPLWWLAWEAANLLAGDGARTVRRCANDRCLWLFLDRSRRRNRRWCDMKVCGSRAKARAYYERTRSRSGPRPSKPKSGRRTVLCT
jgi:predicted RNA-binding Zn ribbon-like protein